MRQVLIVSYDFPPRGGTSVLRVGKFVQYLPEFGWRPVVVTAAGRGWMHDRELAGELPPELEVIFVPDPGVRRARTVDGPSRPAAAPGQPSLARALRQMLIPDPRILWVPGAVRAAARRIKRADIAAVLTTSPPHSTQLAGYALKRRFPQLPWVMDLRDIWSDSPAIRDPRIHKLNYLLEDLCLRTADRSVVVTNTMRRLFEQTHSVSAARLHTITNGYDPADIPRISESHEQGPLRVVYLGTMVGTRAPAVRGLFGALQRLSDDGIGIAEIQLRLIGDFDPLVHREAAPLVARGIVTLLPFISHAEAVLEMARADALLVVMPDDRESGIAVPNKLYEYLAIGRPILALTPPGEITRLLEDAAAGIVSPPFDLGRIEQALRHLIHLRKQNAMRSREPDDRRLHRFHRRELTRRLAALLDEVTDGKTSSF